MKIRFARIRKAIVAGVGAGAGAAITYQVSIGFKLDTESLSATAGAFIATGVPVMIATYKARNTGTVAGSDLR